MNGERIFLCSMESIKHLRILFEPKFKLHSYVNNTINRSHKIFGFIHCNRVDFTDQYTLKYFILLVSVFYFYGIRINWVVNVNW